MDDLPSLRDDPAFVPVGRPIRVTTRRDLATAIKAEIAATPRWRWRQRRILRRWLATATAAGSR